MAGPPFAERGGRMRGVLDVATFRYPAFVFCGPVGRVLPVFHLHESDPEVLQRRLDYLADGGYRTVTTDAIRRFVVDGVHPGSRTVALCFDDCWATLWTVAVPLLRRHGMTAIAFAIPARVADAEAVRPTIEEDPAAARADRSDIPFATWPELKAMQDSGVIDVQSHTWSHSSMFAGEAVVDYVKPEFAGRPLLNRPLASGDGLRWLTPAELGAPIHLERSRMSDGLRFYDDEAVRARCVEHVSARGGAAFFQRPGWRTELDRIAGAGSSRWETRAARGRAIVEELDRARATLENRLRTSVTRVCMPWGIAGAETRAALRTTGCDLAFADRLGGRRVVATGDDPHALMRLHERFICCLPGRGRRWFLTAR
ncbi:MAG TPA: polysaccharide deacetylase family protein [Vicinamibacterales bacterium]|nr:polysaccharide deacetylase family protein [Vicinamibacterales bacterium]